MGTGVQYSLEGSQAQSLFSELSEVRLETVGINNLALGYNYSIEYVSPNKSKTIIVKSNNQIVRGMFRYKTDVDVIRLVERYLTE